MAPGIKGLKPYYNVIALKKIAATFKKRRKQRKKKIGDWVLAKGLKYWVHSRSQSTNSAEKILNRKYFSYRFWKGKVRWWDSKHNAWLLCKSSGRMDCLRKVLWEILQNLQRNIDAGISFLIRLKSADLQIH